MSLASNSRWSSSTILSRSPAESCSATLTAARPSSSPPDPSSPARDCRRSRFTAAFAFLARSRSSLPKLDRCAPISNPLWWWTEAGPTFCSGLDLTAEREPARPSCSSFGRHRLRREAPTEREARSDHPNVLSFLALSARGHVELHVLAFLERPIASALD